MIKELDEVALTVDLPQHHLKAGDIGVVVHIHGEGDGYILEFFTLDGQTLNVVTVDGNQVRPLGSQEIAHARPLQPVSS